MYQSWLSSYQFAWTPILTYTRRHLQLLDWLESNVEPTAFIDNPSEDQLGIAIGAPDLRMTVSRSGLKIESGLSGLDVRDLMPAIQGVFEVMSPKSVLATRFRITSSVKLEHAAYEEQCTAFASMNSANAMSGSDRFVVIDGSAVIDLVSPLMRHKLEWGIVRRDELLSRLRRPAMSRLGHRDAEENERARVNQRVLPRRKLPEVSVYVEQMGFWQAGGVSSPKGVVDRVAEAEEVASTICRQVTAGFVEIAKGAK